jgi:hypothetical protein
VNKEGTIDHKERNITARKLNGAHRGVRSLVEIQILYFFSYFFDIFLAQYDLNRKYTNFQLNWIEGVAYRNFTIFGTIVKASSQL